MGAWVYHALLAREVYHTQIFSLSWSCCFDSAKINKFSNHYDKLMSFQQCFDKDIFVKLTSELSEIMLQIFIDNFSSQNDNFLVKITMLGLSFWFKSLLILALSNQQLNRCTFCESLSYWQCIDNYSGQNNKLLTNFMTMFMTMWQGKILCVEMDIHRWTSIVRMYVCDPFKVVLSDSPLLHWWNQNRPMDLELVYSNLESKSIFPS